MNYTVNEKGAILIEVDGAAGALVGGSGANQQIAYWTGPNTIDGDAGFTYNPATDTATLSGGFVLDGSANSVITVNGGVANALTLVDDNAIEYLRLITDPQLVVVWNHLEADVDFRVAWGGGPNALFVRGSDGYVGVRTLGPDQALEVVGQLQVTHTDGAGDHLTIQPHTDGVTYFNAFGAGANEGGFIFRTNDGAVISLAIDKGGSVGIGIGAGIAGKAHIDQFSGSAGIPVLVLDQADVDDVFINYIGTSAADGSRSISSDVTEHSAKFGAIRVEINNVTKWVRIYDDWS